MIEANRSKVAALAIAVGVALASASSARAAGYLALPHLITLNSTGGLANFGVEVGFNPQPDPPGEPATVLDLFNPFVPTFNNSYTGGGFTIFLDFQGLGDGTIGLPPAPNSDGRTSFEQTIDGHTLDVNLAFLGGGGPVNPASWVSLNPQPDPPGDVFDAGFEYGGFVDPQFFFTASLDEQPLSFSAAPEPATWEIMCVGLFGMGAALRGHRRKSRVAAATA